MNIEAKLTIFDRQFTYALQITVEDVYGRDRQLPSDFTLAEIEAFLRESLKGTAAFHYIEDGQYEILNAKNRRLALNRNSPLQLVPGTRLVAVVVVETLSRTLNICPQCGCTNLQPLECGGRNW